MTASPVSRSRPRSNGALKGLASVLGFVCLVLFLMAIEQRQAMEAWAAIRDSTGPTISRLSDWARNGASNGIEGLKTAAVGNDTPDAATTEAGVLAGPFRPADDATRETVGDISFNGALIRLERGDVFRTQPLRIAAGDEVFSAAGRTFAAELNARADAQIELRRIVPHDRAQVVEASALCAGAAPGVAALLHRQDRVEVMLFRERTTIGPEAPADALCGVWRFRAQ